MEAVAQRVGVPLWDRLTWPNSTVVILASGPSLSEIQCRQVQEWRESAGGAGAAATRRVISINTTFRRAPWADIIYGCDAPWWNAYYAEARAACAGAFWTQDKKALHHETMQRVESRPAPGLGRSAGIIHQGGNSGFQAVNLAYQAGAARMVLLGFDMSCGHWHGDHPAPLTNTRAFMLPNWISGFARLAADLREAGVDVVNATPGSALTCFPHVDLGEAIA